MIDMSFLVDKDRVAGLEFMNFQNDKFKVALVKLLDEHCPGGASNFVLQKSVEASLLELIKDYTGFENVKINFTDTGNLYMDTGYFSPGHVLNIKGIEGWLTSTDTTVYRWFTQNKDKVFKGGVDYTTGKVTGSFRTIPLELGINVNLTDYFNLKETEKWKMTPVNLLAGGITHELGHAFSGCMMMITQFTDNVVAQASMAAYKRTKRTEDRVVVLKDTATLLGMPAAKADELLEFAKQDNDESFLLYFTKLTAQRNSQRALSIGVQEMTSEVVADMYAIRMGCERELIAAISVLTTRGVIVSLLSNLMTSVVVAAVTGYIVLIPSMVIASGVTFIAIPVMCATFAITFLLSYFFPYFSGVYNADPRRLEDAVRQLIAKVKESKGMPSADKTKLINEISQLLKVVEQARPWFDNTTIYRAIGWVFSGSDFKLREIEHFTQALNNNEMTILAERLKGV